ncbi:MAG: alpha-1,4-glucan:maltose-1-phosphate maltosyltransferase [Gemmatimonadales bacterium]|nr:MAG: alpha-1,4-glucan:maltose-1-phosphate maltosyltransferase [Gemmatimonadales bacterium]
MTSTKPSARRARSSIPARPPRLIIENIRPSVDGGRFPAKRLVGDRVVVEATVYKEGHDLIAARVLYRPPGERRWWGAPMVYERDFDRCRGEFSVDRIGTWEFTVEAWTDRFGSWRSDLERRGGGETHVDLLEGALLIEEASRRAKGEDRAGLKDAARVLREEAVPVADRTRRALSAELEKLVQRYLPPADLTRAPAVMKLWVDRPEAGFGAWYEMFPRSQSTVPGKHGTFDDAARRLAELKELGFDVIYLPPIHPIGRTHRKGKNHSLVAGPDDPGSPWAIGNEHGGHTAVEPQLGTLEDFERFVRRARELGMEVALDYALQCSPDHPWVKEHPEWFSIRPDGSIKYAENPPKKYQDIYPLNFWCQDYPALWRACKEILEFWIARGVKIFRVDNPHTKPFAFWEWLIGEMRREHPEVIFLSEAFTRPARMKALAKLGFHQSYTYFTWRNTAPELREYLTELTRTDMVEYFRPNFFTNTPDILHAYLQQGGRPAFRVRLVLAATLSPVYGIYSGFELCENTPFAPGSEEYLNSEKYEIKVRDWNAPGNIKEDIAIVNRIRREHRALQRLDNLTFCHSENDQILCYHKHAPGDDLLIAVNLDPHRVQETMVHVPLEALELSEEEPFEVEDLLTGERYGWRGRRNYVRLDPERQVAHIFLVHRASDPAGEGGGRVP